MLTKSLYTTNSPSKIQFLRMFDAGVPNLSDFSIGLPKN